MSITPRILLIVGPSILSRRRIAAVENTTNAPIIGKRRFHVTYLTYCNITTVAEVRERSPERVTASAYDGIRKGRAVIMNIPKPKPIVRCTKLAPIARRNIGRLNSINCIFLRTHYVHKDTHFTDAKSTFIVNTISCHLPHSLPCPKRREQYRIS